MKALRVLPLFLREVESAKQEKNLLTSGLFTLQKVDEKLSTSITNQSLSAPPTYWIYINEEALLGPSISGFCKGLLGIAHALIRASSRGEVTLTVCADYSIAFDTVQFKSVLTKMHNLGFSTELLLWMVDNWSKTDGVNR